MPKELIESERPPSRKQHKELIDSSNRPPTRKVPKEKHPRNNNFFIKNRVRHGHSKSLLVDGLFQVTLPKSGIDASFDIVNPGR